VGADVGGELLEVVGAVVHGGEVGFGEGAVGGGLGAGEVEFPVVVFGDEGEGGGGRRGDDAGEVGGFEADGGVVDGGEEEGCDKVTR
jgi:hypothetical protein